MKKKERSGKGITKGGQEVKGETVKHGNVILCRCEDVTREEVVNAIRRGARSVAAIRRRTSAGMGLCHGRICTRQIAQVLKEVVGIPSEELKPARVRPPIRPILVAAFEEREGDY